MPVMPAYQSYPYMEPPSFVVPQTHLHLMDYRRLLNPQYYQTMAYQSRRFRYQSNSQTREMTNSEVQTEPLSGTERTASTQPEASSSSSVRSSSPPSNQLSSVAVQEDDQKDVMAPPTNGSFMIQTEEVRIECCATPVGLQLLRSHEASGLSHSYSQDLVQCSSALEAHVMDNASAPPEDQSEQGLHSCPDLLLVGTQSSAETDPALEEQEPAGRVFPRETPAVSATSKTFQRQIQVPFDPKYLEELRRMESMVWSAEDSLIPSSQSFINNDSAEKPAEESPTADVPSVREEPPAEGTRDGPPSPAGVLVDPPGTLEATAELRSSAEAADQPYLLLLDKFPPGDEDNEDKNDRSVPEHQDSSFESLPAYLPSASWLADFESVRYRNRFPPAVQKQNGPLSRGVSDLLSRRRKADLECKGRAVEGPSTERDRPRGKLERRSLSDHECCLGRNQHSQNSFSPYGSKRDRLCTRCLAKRPVCTSPRPGLDSCTLSRKAALFQRIQLPAPTCDACTRRSKKRPLQSSSPDGVRRPGRDSEGESSENSCSRPGTKGGMAEGVGRTEELKRPLASKQNLLVPPGGSFSKLRERNCLCTRRPCQFVPRERLFRCPHGNAAQEMDENCAVPLRLQEKWKHVEPFYYHCQRGQIFYHCWNRICCLFSFLNVKLSVCREVVANADS